MLRTSLALVSSCLLFGCASVPKETSEGKAVKIIQSDAPDTCTELASVEWEGDRVHSLSDAKIVLREKTAALGGNVLRLENLGMLGTGGSYPRGVGTAYKCPKE